MILTNKNNKESKLYQYSYIDQATSKNRSNIKKNNFKRKAFTLIELLTVVAIIGIASFTAMTSYSIYSSKGNFAEVTALMSDIKSDLSIAYAETEAFPTSFKGWTAASFNNVSYDRISNIYYAVSPDTTSVYFRLYTDGLGIPNSTEANGAGAGSVRSRVTLLIRIASDGNLLVSCGQWDGSAEDIPLEYMPSACQDTNLSALVT